MVMQYRVAPILCSRSSPALCAFAKPEPTDEAAVLSPLAVGESDENVGVAVGIQTLVTHSPPDIFDIEEGVFEVKAHTHTRP